MGERGVRKQECVKFYKHRMHTRDFKKAILINSRYSYIKKFISFKS